MTCRRLELACIIEKILGEWEERAEIRIFTNGPDLLSQASEDQIVFLDVDMPDMDGMEVGRKLREMGIDCPIIIETDGGAVQRGLCHRSVALCDQSVL